MCQEEKQEIHVSYSLPEGATLATQKRAYSKSHQFDGNYYDGKKSRNKPACEHCGKEGHTAHTKIGCYKLHGHPSKRQGPSSQSNQHEFNKAKAAVARL